MGVEVHPLLEGQATFALTVGRSRADYTADFDNDQVQIQQAIDQVHAAGGGRVIIQAGQYKIEAPVQLKDRVELWGVGRSTQLLGYGTNFAILEGVRGRGVYLDDVTVAHLALDGSNVVDNVWRAGSKGVYATSMRRARFLNLFIRRTPASGLGVDYLIDSIIDGVVVDEAGRLFQALTGGLGVGGNGIGIGTGWYAQENVALTNCHTRNCGNNGIMFEEQLADLATLGWGATVANCTAWANRVGLRLSGNHRINLTNCQFAGNAREGVLIAASYITPTTFNRQVQFDNSHVFSNGTNGVTIDSTGAGSNDQIQITGNQIGANTGHGIEVLGSSTKLQIAGNIINSNTQHGIRLSADTGTIRRVQITGNQIYSNGTAAAGTCHGIIAAQSGSGVLADLQIAGNQIWDEQGTRTQERAILISGTHSGVHVAENDVRGNRNATPVSISAGTGTITRNNVDT